MRDVLPIACFEHLQSSNWQDSDVGLSAYDICDRISPVRNRLDSQELEIDTLMSAHFIYEFCAELVAKIEGSQDVEFRNPEGWQSFINELTIEFSLTDQAEMPFSESGVYILSQLFWSHLTSFKLLTAWLIVDALGKCLNQPRLSISQHGMGLLLSHLSVGGPPIYDVEEMRGRFPNCYQ